MSSEKQFHDLGALDLTLINLVAFREGISLYRANKDHLGYLSKEKELNTLETLDHLEALAQMPNYMKGVNAIGHLVDHLILQFNAGNIDRVCLAEFINALSSSVGRLNNIILEDMRAEIPGTSLEIAHQQFIEQTDRVVPLYEREMHNLTIFGGEEYRGQNRKPLPKNVTDISQYVVVYYTDCFGNFSENYFNLSRLEQTVTELKKLQDDVGFDRWEANLIIH